MLAWTKARVPVEEPTVNYIGRLYRSDRSGSAGFTLLEVTICLAILAISISMAISAILVTAQMNTRAEAEMLATSAAEEALAQFRPTPFLDTTAPYDDIDSHYVAPPASADDRRFFTVPGLQAPAPGQPHGEIIVILDETPDEAAYGRNLGPGGGAPGVDLNGNGRTNDVLAGGFGVDIDGDGALDADPILKANRRLLPVVVLIRWGTGEGIQRLQIMTMVVDRKQ